MKRLLVSQSITIAVFSVAVLMTSCRGSDGGFVDMDSDGINDKEDEFVDVDGDGIDDREDDFVDADSDGKHDYGSTDPTCAKADVEFGMETPTVVLLIDQSGSMDDAFGGMSRWDAVDATLFDPDDGVVAALDAQVRFGLTLYTNPDNSAGSDRCPMLTTVPPAMNNYDAMNDLFNDNSPNRNTPTGAAINVLVDTMLADPDAERNIIILATDGLPDNCEIPNPDYDDPDRTEANITEAESVAAARDAYENGIPLFVISVGDDVGADHLQDMANAGQGLSVDATPGAAYYMGLDPQSLKDAFQDIISGVRNCVLSLDGEVVEGQESKCAVSVDDEAVPFNEENGWQLNSPSEIEILGSTCDAILDGTAANLTVDCPCDAFSPVV